MNEREGKMIVIEGTDATGKTTIANKLAEQAYEEGRRVIRVDEPDGAYRFTPGSVTTESLVPMATELRKVIKNGSLGRTALANVHLFTAARAENWETVAKPALERGEWVIYARNWLSTLIYQGYAEGVDKSFIETVTSDTMGERYMQPDHAFILDINDEKERARRIAERGELENPDTFESRGDDFQQLLLSGYRDVAETQNIPIIHAGAKREDITHEIWWRIQEGV